MKNKSKSFITSQELSRHLGIKLKDAHIVKTAKPLEIRWDIVVLVASFAFTVTLVWLTGSALGVF